MNNEILTDLNWRYTTKNYDPSKKVSEADLTTLFESIRLSASSINSQPWKFIVIDSQEAKERMDQTFRRKASANQAKALDCSQVILFAYNPKYNRDDYSKIVDDGIQDKRIEANKRETGFAGFAFAEMNTDSQGDTSAWTKAQLYLALGNTLHTLARLKIDSTPMEGIDTELVNQEFASELDGYVCDVGLAIGYRHKDDFNAVLPKSRRKMESILTRI